MLLGARAFRGVISGRNACLEYAAYAETLHEGSGQDGSAKDNKSRKR